MTKITIKTNKAQIFEAYQQQQKQLDEHCQQMKVLFGACAFLFIINIL